MSVKIYGIKNCDTMKKAFDWLKESGVAYQFHDYRAEGVDTETLRGWVRALGWEKVLNKASSTFKSLDEVDKVELGAEKAIRLMSINPTMIKRPMLVTGEPATGKTVTAGFKPESYKALFAQRAHEG